METTRMPHPAGVGCICRRLHPAAGVGVRRGHPVGDVEVTPRNEFADHDRLEGLTDLMIADMLKAGKCTVNDVRRHRGLPPVTGEGAGPVSEAANERSAPVEEDPHAWPAATRPALEQLRREPGLSTTQAHIAERYSNEDTSLEKVIEDWNDPNHVYEI